MPLNQANVNALNDYKNMEIIDGTYSHILSKNTNSLIINLHEDDQTLNIKLPNGSFLHITSKMLTTLDTDGNKKTTVVIN